MHHIGNKKSLEYVFFHIMRGMRTSCYSDKISHKNAGEGVERYRGHGPKQARGQSKPDYIKNVFKHGEADRSRSNIYDPVILLIEIRIFPDKEEHHGEFNSFFDRRYHKERLRYTASGTAFIQNRDHA